MSAEPSWTLNYTLTRRDYEDYNWYLFRHDWRLPTWHVALLLGVVAFVVARLAGEGIPWFIISSACLLAGAVYVAFMWMFFRWWISWSLREWPKEGRNITLLADDRGLDFQSPVMNSQSGWKSIVRVASGRGAVYLFLARRVAYLVPLRGFASPSEAVAFAAWASDRTLTARGVAAVGETAK